MPTPFYARPLSIVVEQEPDLARLFRSDFRAVQRHFRREASVDESLRTKLAVLDRNRQKRSGRAAGGPAPQPHKNSVLASSPKLIPALWSGEVQAVTLTLRPHVSGGLLRDLYRLTTAFSLASRLETLSAQPVTVVAWLGSTDMTPVQLLGVDEGGSGIAFDPARASQSAFDALLGSSPHADQVRDAYSRSFGSLWETPATEMQPGEKDLLRSGYANLLVRLAGQRKLVVIDEEKAEISAQLAPFFNIALSRSSALNRAMRARSMLMRREGLTAQPPPVHHAHVRYIPGERISAGEPYQVELREGRAIGYSETERPAFSYSLPTFLRVLKRAPDRFLPDDWLRPVAQSWLFPVVATVVDPAALAAHALVEDAFELLDLVAPVPVLAQQFLLIPDCVQALMEEYHLSLEDVWGDLHARRDRVVQRADRLNIPAREHQLQLEVHRALDEAVSGLEVLDERLHDDAKSLGSQLDDHVRAFFGKVQQVHERGQVQVFRDFRVVENWLRPGGRAQWNVFCPIPFLASYGLGLVDGLSQMPPDPMPQFIQLHQNPA